MPGIVELKLGDLFDGPCDMIVLPCSTVFGKVTRSVAKRLREYSIPQPRKLSSLGAVEIAPFDGGENIAQYVAFAASVQLGKSTPEAIALIGASLGEFTINTESVRTISAPMLGTGSGRLECEVAVAALSKGFKSNAADNAILTIHVLEQSDLERLQQRASSPKVTEKAPETPLRLFISYSGTSNRHKTWVAELGTFLRANGIDARLDQWHLRPGMDLPQWMTNELGMAKRVLIISDARYAARADGRTGGVGWETMLIQGSFFQEPPDSRKFLVIVREDDLPSALPSYLRNRLPIHWPSGANEGKMREQLLNELYDVNPEPPIGGRPKPYVTP